MVRIGRSYHFSFFKCCLLHMLLTPFLNTLTQVLVSSIFKLLYYLHIFCFWWNKFWNPLGTVLFDFVVILIVCSTQQLCRKFCDIFGTITFDINLVEHTKLNMSCEENYREGKPFTSLRMYMGIWSVHSRWTAQILELNILICLVHVFFVSNTIFGVKVRVA